MLALVFANGLFNPPDPLPATDLLIAADGGALHCQSLGLTPDVVIGDFDSLSEDDLENLSAQGTRLIRYPTHKDATDLELAVRYAQEAGADAILILGGLGARWDQTLANLLLPALVDFKQTRIRFLDGRQEIGLLRGGETLTIQGRKGDTVSLVPVGGAAHNITTQGLEYPLHRENLLLGSTRGVSNVLLIEPASVSLEDGLLLCVVIHQ